MIAWIDLESRSHCDLKTRGVYAYATDPSTEVICLSYAFGDGPVQIWVPIHPFPERVANWTGQIRAHNAAFERLIFKHVLGLDFKPEQFYCTAAQARANCAPGSLEDVGRFAGAGMRKDHKGKALVRKFCVPPYSDEDPAELIAYCEQDVRAMRAISQSMRELTDEELRDYQINERINDRGIGVDLELAAAAQKYSQIEARDITRRVAEITEGAVTSVRSPVMRAWVLERLTDEQRALTRTAEDGEVKESLDKSVRANLLACDDLDDDVREVVQSADDIWSSSVAKFKRMTNLAQDDRRVRGAFVFAGGAATGRFSSYGLQVHNFTRKTAKDPIGLRETMLDGRPLPGRVADVLRSMLRPAIIPAPGNVFVGADWSAIEARVNPWLSNDPGAQELLDAFAAGEDIYIREARGIFGRQDIDDGQRQIGKVAILSCGFGGSVNAFAAMGRNYGLKIPEHDAKRIVDAWRRSNAWAVRFWHQLERAYTAAMRNAGHVYHAGRISYLFDRTHLWYALPSGRVLCYPYARFDDDGGVSYAKSSWKPKADAAEWPRARLWPGLACENVTQAAAADVLRAALRVLDASGLAVVLHCHDEILLESPEQDAEACRHILMDTMQRAPEWAAGLPLKAEAKITARYGK